MLNVDIVVVVAMVVAMVVVDVFVDIVVVISVVVVVVETTQYPRGRQCAKADGRGVEGGGEKKKAGGGDRGSARNAAKTSGWGSTQRRQMLAQAKC